MSLALTIPEEQLAQMSDIPEPIKFEQCRRASFGIARTTLASVALPGIPRAAFLFARCPETIASSWAQSKQERRDNDEPLAACRDETTARFLIHNRLVTGGNGLGRATVCRTANTD